MSEKARIINRVTEADLRRRPDRYLDNKDGYLTVDGIHDDESERESMEQYVRQILDVATKSEGGEEKRAVVFEAMEDKALWEALFRRVVERYIEMCRFASSSRKRKEIMVEYMPLIEKMAGEYGGVAAGALEERQDRLPDLFPVDHFFDTPKPGKKVLSNKFLKPIFDLLGVVIPNDPDTDIYINLIKDSVKRFREYVTARLKQEFGDDFFRTSRSLKKNIDRVSAVEDINGKKYVHRELGMTPRSSIYDTVTADIADRVRIRTAMVETLKKLSEISGGNPHLLQMEVYDKDARGHFAKYIDGLFTLSDLAQKLEDVEGKEEEPVSARILVILKQAINGLAYLEHHRIVLQDIDSENIGINPNGPDGHESAVWHDVTLPLPDGIDYVPRVTKDDLDNPFNPYRTTKPPEVISDSSTPLTSKEMSYQFGIAISHMLNHENFLESNPRLRAQIEEFIKNKLLVHIDIRLTPIEAEKEFNKILSPYESMLEVYRK